MAFESKSIFKLAKVYQSSSVGLSLHKQLQTSWKREWRVRPGEIEDAEIQEIKSARQEAFPDEYTARLRQRELPKNGKLLD